jgi:LCP family protein required for cell wall assembly
MTSFLRDSYVYIPAKGYNAKLNAAFAWGGAKMLVDTIEYNFKVKIDDYVIIDFVGFQKLIDLMGGLDVDGVTEAEAKYMRDVVKIVYCKEGKNHFTGAAALWYCRIRKLDDDFHRTERQRKVMNAIIKQALHRNPFELMRIVEQVLPMIRTSLSRNDLLLVGLSSVFNYIGGKNPQTQIPAEDTWHGQRVNGQDVLKMDLEKNAALLKEFIYQ